MAKQDADIIVLGAGVIGLSCALALQRAGLKVLVLDRKGVAAEASQGNAGAFAFTEVEPLATPGIMRKALAGCSTHWGHFPCLLATH